MTNLININQDMTMSSREIAELTGKEHSHIIRDIRNQFSELYNISKDEPKMDDKLKQYLIIEHDNRGYVSNIELDKEQTYTLIAGYNVKLRNAIIKRWQELESQKNLTVFGQDTSTHRGALLALVASLDALEQKEIELKEVKQEIEHKQEVIIELVDNLDLIQKRQVLNKVVREGGNYQERWRALYSHFENIYHCNVKMMSEKHGCYKLDYIDKTLGKLDKLFEIACKLYETDVKQVKSELFPDML